MDFTNRNTQSVSANPSTAPGNSDNKKRRDSEDDNKLARIGVFAAIVAVVVLLIAATLTISSSKDSNKLENEGKLVNSSRLQAVFLNTGQVYFGNIKSLNSKYTVLANIYYLQTSSGNTNSTNSTSASNVSLVKLGCELHQPYDQMVINQNQITFWENLQDGGQVAKAVKAFSSANPSGQKCSDQSASASTTSGTKTQGAATTTTTPATTPTKP